MTVSIIQGDCREVLAGLESDSFHACVTDAPYELNFMGRSWDRTGVAFRPETWAAVHRVLKPGGHLLAFGGTRTYHRLACAIEDAGFEVRDTIMWIYGSGFPKSLDVGKAIDRKRDDDGDWRVVGMWLRQQREARGLKQKQVAALWPSETGGLTGCVANWELGFNGPKWDQWQSLKEFINFGDDMDAEVWRLNGRKGQPGEAWFDREVIGRGHRKNDRDAISLKLGRVSDDYDLTAPATEAAREWQGWGTALKPACEMVCVARKPLSERTVAANVLRHGTGALNVDASRVAHVSDSERDAKLEWSRRYGGKAYPDNNSVLSAGLGQCGSQSANGRWPANVCLSYPEDEYELRYDITVEQRKALFRWFHENA